MTALAPRPRAWVLAFALLLSCGSEAPPPEIAPPPVMVVRAQARDVVDRIVATGQLLAQAEATVAAQGGGEVTEIAADEGSAVAKGQSVIEIDPERRELELEDASASVVQAEAQLEEARRESSRIEQLLGRGAVSQAQLDEARTRLRLARSRLVGAKAQHGLADRALRDASVPAPFEGLIARRHVNVGEFVNEGDALFDLVALDPVEVEFHLAEVDSSRVAVGQSVEVRVAAFPDERFAADVSVVSPTIDSATRTRRVKAVVPNPAGRLLPGSFARVDLGVAQRSGVVMVPREAVLQRADGAVLYRLVGTDRAERMRVETGVFRGEDVEIQAGVAAGDWIVVRGQTGLVDGAAVSLRTADGSAVDPASLAAGEPGG